MKYGELSPSLYTGTVNVSVPFYIYKDKDFEIPISFDYSSNGNIANMRGGVMGNGWTLNAGGCITREIKGIPDNNTIRHIPGFYELHKSNINQPDETGNMAMKLIRSYNLEDCHSGSDNGVITPNILFCDGCYSGNFMSKRYDAEPDIFHFNFMGYSGTFHLGFKEKIYIYNTNVNPKDFKITITEPNSGSGNRFESINIFTSDGYQYVFESRGSASDNLDVIKDDDGEIKRVLTWRITKIVAPNGRYVIFDYNRYMAKSYRPNTYCDQGNLLFLANPDCSPEGRAVQPTEQVMYENCSYISSIKSITIDDGPEIIFDYTKLTTGHRELYYELPPHNTLKEIDNYDDESVRLTSVSVKYNSIAIKECSMAYKSKNNARSYLDYIDIDGEGKYSMNYFNWSDYDTQYYPVNGIYGFDHWGYYNGKNTNVRGGHFLKISSLKPNFDEEIDPYNFREPDPDYAVLGMLEKITYPTGGYSIFEYAPHDYSKAVKRLHANAFNPTLIDENAPRICGGLRIKSINNYSSDDTFKDSKEFEYTNDGISSGILLHYPRYHIKYSANSHQYTEPNTYLWSENLVHYSGTHIEYSKVTEKRSDGSRIEYNFTNSQNHIDCTQPVGDSFEQIQGENWVLENAGIIRAIIAPNISFQSLRGKLIKKDIFKSTNDILPISSETSIYSDCVPSIDRKFDFVPVYLIHAFAYTPIYFKRHDISNTTKAQHLENGDVNEITYYTYNAHGQIATTSTRDSKNRLQETKYQYVTDLENPTGIHSTMLQNNVINYPLKEEIYVDGVLVGGKHYTYFQPRINNGKSFIRVSQVETYNNEKQIWELEAKYNAYDITGNLLESENRNGIKTSYLWGYNGLYLVAKADNCSLSQIKSVNGLGVIETEPIPGTVNYYETALRAIPEAEITTLEYYPFVGLKKMTDPSGRVTNYDYNVTGKLKSVFDNKNNLRNEYYYSTDQN